MVDKTFKALADLYFKMCDKLKYEIEALGGTVTLVAPDDLNVQISVDPKLQTYAEELIAEIMSNYDRDRKKIMNADPFVGVKILTHFSNED